MQRLDFRRLLVRECNLPNDDDSGSGGEGRPREAGADLPQSYHPIAPLNRGEFALSGSILDQHIL